MLQIRKNQMYKNKRTNETAKYLRTDVVMDAGRAIRVHILLLKGLEETWDDDSFLPNWVLQDAFDLDYPDVLVKRILATAMAKVDFALNESDAAVEDASMLSKIAIEVAIGASRTHSGKAIVNRGTFPKDFNAIDAAETDGFMRVCVETARAIMVIVGQQ